MTDLDQYWHDWITGILFAIFCNCTVVIGIITEKWLLLLPWLLLYGLSKNSACSLTFLCPCNFPIPGDVCLILITFYNIIFFRREILENIALLTMCVCVTGMWVIINQIRQDTRDKRNMEMEEEALALVETDIN